MAPRVTVAELNDMVKAGNYHLIRREKVGHLLETTGVVADGPVGEVPHLRLDGDRQWSAGLHHAGRDHGLRPGDRVTFRALLLDEAYGALALWSYSWAKAEEKPAADPPAQDRPRRAAKPTPGPVDLSGQWLLTMPRGFEYDATLESAGEPGLYRLRCAAENLRGIYEARDGRLTLVRPEDTRLTGLAWEVRQRPGLGRATRSGGRVGLPRGHPRPAEGGRPPKPAAGSGHVGEQTAVRRGGGSRRPGATFRQPADLVLTPTAPARTDGVARRARADVTGRHRWSGGR